MSDEHFFKLNHMTWKEQPLLSSLHLCVSPRCFKILWIFHTRTWCILIKDTLPPSLLTPPITIFYQLHFFEPTECCQDGCRIINRNMSKIQESHPQRKLSVSLSQQEPGINSSSAGSGTSWATLISMLWFWLAYYYVSLVHTVMVTVSSYVQCPCCV